MRRLAVLAVVATASALPLLAAGPASADERTCYTLGVPGQDHYEYCTYLPVELDDLIQ